MPNNPTGVWVGDYTIQPENGGLGVFAHEYAHDLGLPDLYDTSGNTGGAENTTGFWDLMTSGANIGDGSPDGIGDAPTNMSAWDKFQLGWLTYDQAVYGKRSEHKLNAVGVTTKKGAQAVVVTLPKEQNVTVTPYGAPTSGTTAYWSGSGDVLDRRDDVARHHAPGRWRPLAVAEGVVRDRDVLGLRLRARGRRRHDDESRHVQVRRRRAAARDRRGRQPERLEPSAAGSRASPERRRSATRRPAITAWVDLTADLSPWAGKTVKLQIRYVTDGFVDGRGFEFDDVAVTQGATTVWADDAEGRMTGTLDGFIAFPGNMSRTDDHYYIAEYRPYRDYDTSLATAYNFGFLETLTPDWVETHPYMPGCWSGTGTSGIPTTASATTRVRARPCPSTRIRCSTTGPTAS